MDVIIQQLLKKPHLRDDDRALCATIWWYEVFNEGLHPEKICAKTWLALYSDGKMTTGESITRARRKAQEIRPDIRGKLWEERHQQGIEAANNSRLPYKELDT